MIAGKDKKNRKSRKRITSIPAADDQNPNLNNEVPQRVFLYLQLKSILFPSEEVPFERVEIELKHTSIKITSLSEHFMPQNIINVDKINIEKPTFSLTIEQDSIKHITSLCDAPLVLTLYCNICERPGDQYVKTLADEDKKELFPKERILLAQGHIDVMEHFNKKRSQSSNTIYLYPLETSSNAMTCITEWEIYSLQPLLRNTIISNVVFITLGSLYNMNDYFFNNNNDLVANLSFISKTSNENNEYEKIFICKFTTFSKRIISQQNLSKKWENLKNREINNSNCMGILSESKFNLSKLFVNVLSTENLEFNFDEIDISDEYALICNSMHRYILTDIMKKILEATILENQYQMILEIFSEQDKSKILLQGFIDLSIFAYPEVRYCSFAIELRPPGYKLQHSPSPKNTKSKNKNKIPMGSTEQSLLEDKIPFAILEICLNKPITTPIQDMTEFSIHKFGQCSMKEYGEVFKKSLKVISAENYGAFDDLVREILDHMILNNVQTIDEDSEFFCLQLGNLTNRMIKLVACDFNIRTPTNTNIEFANLMTTVYQELVDRIYKFINNYRLKDIENITKTQDIIISRLSLAKYMYEVGNTKMADLFMNNIREDYPNNPMLKFYLFLYDMERQDFSLAKEYLEKSIADKDVGGQLLTDLTNIYLNYKLEKSENTEENLIRSLYQYSSYYCPKSIIGWILLYCIYKKHNYKPGMAYTRLKYENLYNNMFVKLEYIPISRWDIYMPYKIHLKSVKGQNFTKVLDQLLLLGLFEFAEWIFKEIANECLELEQYFIFSTFKILKNNLDEKFSIKSFPVEKLLNPLHLRATLSLVNGNLEYFQDPTKPDSMIHYNAIIDIKDLDIYHYYQLGILRYAYRMMEEKRYEEAAKAFLCCCDEQVNCIVAAIGRGKACYHLGQLEESEKYFALSTKYGIYMSDTWAYLALINLRKGKNYNALECWKYARLDTGKNINLEILHELNKTNPSDVFLYVDVPNITIP